MTTASANTNQRPGFTQQCDQLWLLIFQLRISQGVFGSSTRSSQYSYRQKKITNSSQTKEKQLRWNDIAKEVTILDCQNRIIGKISTLMS